LRIQTAPSLIAVGFGELRHAPRSGIGCWALRKSLWEGGSVTGRHSQARDNSSKWGREFRNDSQDGTRRQTEANREGRCSHGRPGHRRQRRGSSRLWGVARHGLCNSLKTRFAKVVAQASPIRSNAAGLDRRQTVQDLTTDMRGLLAGRPQKARSCRCERSAASAVGGLKTRATFHRSNSTARKWQDEPCDAAFRFETQVGRIVDGQRAATRQAVALTSKSRAGRTRKHTVVGNLTCRPAAARAQPTSLGTKTFRL